MQTAIKYDLYSDLEQLPKSLTGEIITGQLYGHPRPSARHMTISTGIGSELHGSYHRGRGGPGGWRILVEPEVHLSLDTDVVVPDIAGWRRERMPEIPDSHKFTIVPDWVCEVLSPSTASIDQEIKMPLYAKYGVKYFWIVDPAKLTLEAYKLVNNDWSLQGSFKSGDSVCVEPFDAISINIDELID